MSAGRTIFKVAFFTIFLFIALLVGMLYSIDESKYKLILASQLNKMTGAKVQLNGPMKISIFPLPHVDLNDIKFNIEISKSNTLKFQIKSMAFALPWRSLFEDIKEIKHIDAKAVLVNYEGEQNKDFSLFFEQFEGNLISTPDTVGFPSFKFKLGSNKVKGNALLSFNDDKIKLTGNLEAQQWQSVLSSKTLNVNDKTILNKILNDDWLKQLDAYITVKINKLQLADSVLNNTKFDVSMKNNRLSVVYKGMLSKIEHSGKITLLKGEHHSPQIDIAFKADDPDGVKTINGDLKVVYQDDKPLLKGDISFKKIDIPLEENNTPESNNSLSSLSTSLERIRSIQSELTIQAQEINLGKLNIQKATIDAKVRKEALNILVKSGFEQGSQESQFSINFADSPGGYALLADINLKNANASNVIKLLDKDSMVDGGTLNLTFNGNTKGNSFNTMISNLSGKAVVYIQNMKLLNKTIDSRHLDLFAAILKSFDNKKNETLFECVAIKLDFLNGIAKANQSIALETPDIYAMGAGVLNLRTQKLDFAFNLYPRSNMNIELGSLDQLVYLKGTIKNPEVELSPKAIIKEGGTLALGVATGGLSLLAEKLYKVATKQSSPCKQVLTHG